MDNQENEICEISKSCTECEEVISRYEKVN